MDDMQLDMFEVQLGAAILLQFTHRGRVIRVLADAGVKASGYALEHVRDKLLGLLSDEERHIDLIIGTHYDEDHLRGLVPIIEDDRFTFGEAWMPPVLNDMAPHAIDQDIDPNDFLAIQFYAEEGTCALATYLAAKQGDCEWLASLEHAEVLEDPRYNVNVEATRVDSTARWYGKQVDLSYFRQQLDALEDNDCNHGTEQELFPSTQVEEVVARYQQDAPYLRYANLRAEWRLKHMQSARIKRPDIWSAQMATIGNIRKGSAKDAINAKALHDVVQALAARNIDVRCEIIPDGQPRRYLWNAERDRFIPTKKVSDAPELLLLGPSQSLVRKHWDRLPVQDAATIAFSFRMEIKQITPSNQLSYVARFGFRQQGILISGDAGFVDFKSSGRDYFPGLLGALLPLHVIQVAHHAGNNAHFYRVLDAAQFPEQSEPSLMLLSHATHDKTRPSPAFRAFLLSTLREGEDVQLLFTSEPTRAKVKDYLLAIHPSVGINADRGDIRIRFGAQGWEVDKHAIRL